MKRYTVRQLNQELHGLISSRYPVVEVEGEIGELARPASGHVYLTLRDHDAILGCVCWRDSWQAQVLRPQRGDRVVARGRLGVYPGKGAYQLYVSLLSPAGEGALAAEIARRRARLEADGLLDPRRKRPLPRFPRVVGVATSLTGAALQDFLQVSRERFPAARVLVAPCQVQGAHAAPSVVQAVDVLLRDGRSQVIVVTRGGGGKEDLLAFQDEGLARFLAASPVPVVSAVGHQIDTTLADLVADAVAPTPTAAAVCVLPDGSALAQRVDEVLVALEAATRRGVERRRNAVMGLQARVRHPRERLADVRRRLVELEGRGRLAVSRRLPTHRRVSHDLEERLRRAGARLPLRGAPVDVLHARLQRALVSRIGRDRERVVALLARAEALSPHRVLGRGYAVVLGTSGVVSSIGDVAPGERLALVVRDGRIPAVVASEYPPAEEIP